MEAVELARARPQKFNPRPLEILQGTAPAAGANFTETNPGRPGWTLVAVRFRFVADANVADRAVTVDYDDGNGLVFLSHGFGAVVAAGTTEDFTFAANIGQAAWNTGGQAFVPLYPAILQDGRKLQVNVANKQAGDQLSRIVEVFERQVYAPS